jgi:hypothetical protein
MPTVGPIPYTPPQSTFVPGTSPNFSFQELDLMRTYMLMPKLFATPGALLEGVFSSINGLNSDPLDMGYTQFAIRQVLFNLVQLETQLAYLEAAPIMGTVEIEGKIITDPQGTAFMYRYVDGPALINQLASRLAFPPAGNYFAPVETAPGNSMGSYRNQYRQPRLF